MFTTGCIRWAPGGVTGISVPPVKFIKLPPPTSNASSSFQLAGRSQEQQVSHFASHCTLPPRKSSMLFPRQHSRSATDLALLISAFPISTGTLSEVRLFQNKTIAQNQPPLLSFLSLLLPVQSPSLVLPFLSPTLSVQPGFYYYHSRELLLSRVLLKLSPYLMATCSLPPGNILLVQVQELACCLLSACLLSKHSVTC